MRYEAKLPERKRRRKTLVVCPECHERIHSENTANMISGEPYTSRGVRTVWEGGDVNPAKDEPNLTS